MVDSEKKVSVVSEGSYKGDVTLNVPEGKTRIAIVGSKAKGEVDFTIQGNESVTLEVIE